MSTLGVLLVVLGLALVIAEAHVPTHGALGAGAAAALTAAVVLVLSGSGATGGEVVAAGVTVALAGLALSWLLLRTSLATSRLRVRSGTRRSRGKWRRCAACRRQSARCNWTAPLARPSVGARDDGELVAEGSAVVVESIDGLTLTVRPAEEWEVH